jgi:hypothetical protein
LEKVTDTVWYQRSEFRRDTGNPDYPVVYSTDLGEGFKSEVEDWGNLIDSAAILKLGDDLLTR